jgi:hypothetical protein
VGLIPTFLVNKRILADLVKKEGNATARLFLNTGINNFPI